MRLAIYETMSHPREAENADQHLWFAIDELDALGPVDGLKDALARLRRCVLGFQSMLLGLVLIGPIAACTPVQGTYYEPNPADGAPERSIRKHERKDTSAREIDGLQLRVHAEFRPANPLIVGISVIYSGESVVVNPNRVEVHVLPDGQILHPQAVKGQDQPNRYDSKHWIKMYALTFAEVATADQIAIVFSPDSVTTDGQQVSFEPFRFTKVTKRDTRVY
jgi:hypothetical protein